jgi:hypothetical protein
MNRRHDERDQDADMEFHPTAHTPFGDALVFRVWRCLKKCRIDEGFAYGHRDYCGHGLVRAADGVALVLVEDGFPRDVLQTWRDEASFVAFWARQSDRSCGGHDQGEPLFFTSDDWLRDNQRITLARLREAVGA